MDTASRLSSRRSFRREMLATEWSLQAGASSPVIVWFGMQKGPRFGVIGIQSGPQS
jgi:hypothetical protein